jgi:long-chain acyl-CoA synthetase
MKGYWNRPEDTATALRDGWLVTGDLGSLDARGYLTLWGRTHDLINVGGYKVLAHEVEDALASHPDIEEAVVVGMPDPLEVSGEIVKAFVVLKAGAASAEELKRHCAQRLEPWKVPGVVSIVPSLPRTSSGKLQKQRLLAGMPETVAEAR